MQLQQEHYLTFDQMQSIFTEIKIPDGRKISSSKILAITNTAAKYRGNTFRS